MSAEFQKEILSWYKKNGRHTLPWRRKVNQSAYRILVSELMLQQTQVDRVIPKYSAFLKNFPTARALAQAKVADVLKAWQGLGYNRRALYLQRACQVVQKEYGARFPRTAQELEKLPGVGPYTARAVSVFAFNNPEVLIETNVRRVFIYFFFTSSVIARSPQATKQSRDRHVFPLRENPRDDRIVSDAELMPLIEKYLYKKDPRMWYSALMDYGALAMEGILNPNRKSKHYIKQSKFEGSKRYVRAHIVRYLLEHKKASSQEILKSCAGNPYLEKYAHELGDILDALTREGCMVFHKGKWHII
ncbi:MAG: hypothetical protein A3H59_02990 [Candidatus Jacksonbacteria bacterium RIFCSPLOWO2_02_FULL_43_9]|nr:MAG: HhH-GPD family protein [Parcubacteria group bacterium GW2011_GWA2_43_13]OGY69357.1 MAG: hypothetical protein A3B94_03530 [Candidatus Jacksonbacteria bacterium RIFCSPHIGHO2_02_FULL_43_10]OGY70586.1 MAG: hypothetical protein A2986_02660 [Candidatus Jacksonbacteria bacterium RIFCSPLOWO2_01_FULL_44_13]OGY74167.1 MAG: hypothetical protein A3H59_02990 [Candidatus Jacksonbacteria bacterium RIFCSPLOWO2_02_FULL_43_9]HAZ16364.1 endonuclease III [Candidatus Jacksonbacteria bacterium]